MKNPFNNTKDKVVTERKIKFGDKKASEALIKPLKVENVYKVTLDVNVIDDTDCVVSGSTTRRIYAVKELVVGAYLSGKSITRKGDPKNLSVNPIKEMYLMSEVYDPTVGEVVRGIVMDAKLATNEDARRIVATYCYYLECPMCVDTDIAFRICNASGLDFSTISANVENGELLNSTNPDLLRIFELLAYAQTTKLYGAKFVGHGVGSMRLGGVYSKMTKTSVADLRGQVRSDMMKDRKCGAVAKTAAPAHPSSTSEESEEEEDFMEVDDDEPVSEPVQQKQDKQQKAAPVTA